MIQFVTVIHVIVCVLLILVVLLQQGKKDGMGSAFGGGSSSVFGARGAETFLEKLTKILAIIFMCTSLSLVYFSSQESSGSLLSNETPATESSAPSTETAPAAPTDAATAPNAASQAASDASKNAPTPVSPAK